ASPAAAVVIDSFESGNLNMVFEPAVAGVVLVQLQSPNAGTCIAPQRGVSLEYITVPVGPMTATLQTWPRTEDGIHLVHPGTWVKTELIYEGGPWDLTDGGTATHIRIPFEGGGPETEVEVALWDGQASASISHAARDSGTLIFRLSEYAPHLDLTSVLLIQVSVVSHEGTSITIHNIATSSGLPFLYQAYAPGTFDFVCQAPGRGGDVAPVMAWNWRLAGPSSPVIAGPVFQVDGIAPSCPGARFEWVDASGDLGAILPGGSAAVTWLDSSFEQATFELRFTTPDNAPYAANPSGDPEVTLHENAIVIAHDLLLSDLPPGLSDGTVHQELVIAVAAGQDAYFPWADALPLGGGGSPAGYSLAFGVEGIGAYDPGAPLLEVFTIATYEDLGGTTGAPAIASRDAGLTARPSVFRTSTRFVLPADARGDAERVPIDVIDVAGRRVRTLEATGGEALWDGTDDGGRPVAAGVYFARRVGSGYGVARVVRLL
ncbi:MAG: hypothetical protein KC591_12145, partial [Gemmatimonadetes bacterium]|nr:hypothetical protein [Gemmatimonadota bacterium]